MPESNKPENFTLEEMVQKSFLTSIQTAGEVAKIRHRLSKLKVQVTAENNVIDKKFSLMVTIILILVSVTVALEFANLIVHLHYAGKL